MPRPTATQEDCSTLTRYGYRPLGYGREIDIECGPDRQWITELQIPVTPAVAHRR
ncbi:MAG: hypothetical protein JJU45_05750 [Acidimicrobiia bacterium]|nr:hypothetical protein [Acidimicrobiia bacterium]